MKWKHHEIPAIYKLMICLVLSVETCFSAETVSPVVYANKSLNDLSSYGQIGLCNLLRL